MRRKVGEGEGAVKGQSQGPRHFFRSAGIIFAGDGSLCRRRLSCCCSLALLQCWLQMRCVLTTPTPRGPHQAVTGVAGNHGRAAAHSHAVALRVRQRRTSAQLAGLGAALGVGWHQGARQQGQEEGGHLAAPALACVLHCWQFLVCCEEKGWRINGRAWHPGRQPASRSRLGPAASGSCRAAGRQLAGPASPLSRITTQPGNAYCCTKLVSNQLM